MFNISGIISKFVKNSSQRELDRLNSTVKKINEWESKIKEIPDEQFPSKTLEFKSKIDNGASLDNLLPEAYACVREAARRTINERPFDVQLLSAIVLHQGAISEQKTGEGKTLASTMPIYLNSLLGKGVHVCTVNEFLAQRDGLKWMNPIYKFLGLSVGCVTHEMNDSERKSAYAKDITYGVNSEYVFDYLKDAMRMNINEVCQREHFYCLIDEVDDILIDSARTPCVISSSLEDKSDKYFVCNKFIKLLEKSDYDLEEKDKQVMLSEKGIDKIENLSKTYGILKNDNFYHSDNLSLQHHIQQALKANLLFFKDRDYIVKDNKVELIDEQTGRILLGRRLSDGLHSAIEAKEHVDIQHESQTIASITYQNYFRMYSRSSTAQTQWKSGLAGMTGTAQTQAEEFFEIYGLKVVSIPTNKKMIRKDWDDEIFRTEKEKNKAIIDKIVECNKKGQPVLIGTTSISKSEIYSKLLADKRIKYSVLNAKEHAREAAIIAEAGALNSVCCATQLAGRGQDIRLGGNNASKEDQDKVKELGGLFVIGTERNESARVDLQLRGRSGRQGDPGNSIFYVSLEDDLMRIFGSESIDSIMKRFGLKENESITHPWITKAIRRAQSRVESRHFDIRKTLLKFDNQLGHQRQVIFEQRKKILKSNNINEIINSFYEDLIKNLSSEKTVYEREDKIALFKTKIKPIIGRALKGEELDNIIKMKGNEFENNLKKKFNEFRDKRIQSIKVSTNLELEKRIFLQTLDHLWRGHIQYLDHLREAVSLHGYAGKDPLESYKKSSFSAFEQLLNKIKIDFITFLNNLEIVTQEEMANEKSNATMTQINNPKCLLVIKKNEKISRNERCEATGRKYKFCCGAL